ncbi:MAG: alpha/beta hydrolase [Acidimicrobiia bacterium]|nr:alpha/beta hydrolase [Acidimicrobiia bacterium]
MTVPFLVVDEHRVHVRNGGVAPSQSGPALMLVHGAGMDGTVWSQQTRFLSMRGVRALAVDLPGHGQSEGPPIPTIAGMADWLVALIETLGESQVMIAGHSMGTFIALEVATRFPTLVNSVALFGTATAMPVHPDLIDAAEHDLARAGSLMTGWSHAAGSRIGRNPTPGLWMTGGVEALIERSRPGVLLNDLKACNNYEDAEERAAALSCPALVAIGAYDKMTPARSGRAMAKAMVHSPAVEMLEMPGAGHMSLTEEPKIVREALLEAALSTVKEALQSADG